MTREPEARPLRRGWTTGACATAATRAACSALFGLGFPDPVTIRLPRGGTASFALAEKHREPDAASAAVIKDAGDDPDVTHGCLVRATVRRNPRGAGVTFHAGPGVGTVTRPGLTIPPGEPAINPVPRRMMRDTVAEAAAAAGEPADVAITIAIPGGEDLAAKTLNPRLGILGGLSILGTTGIVVPFSCAAWIHSIHRGIDVARAAGLEHVAAATGSTSERAVQALYGLGDLALLDMGDFAGGTLKYLRRHPLPRLSLAGGFAKIAKLAQGHLDLHSARSRLDHAALAAFAAARGAPEPLAAAIEEANTGNQILTLADEARFPLADLVAEAARAVSSDVAGPEVAIEVIVVDRQGRIVGRAPAW
ncbi:cobalt-precorrin-5B (C(1))-methyltransferase [Benzoatithermus flavus]|uniref:Cobalt-precorrin-5B C(1)-methyltransferase n=1 Tax=Benzoatithermus flavus TaxID=3108223 RepID=A0ABU8XNG6_9PROT